MSRGTILAWLAALALLDVVIPVPILAITLLVVVFRRPTWFLEMVRTIYAPGMEMPPSPGPSPPPRPPHPPPRDREPR